MATLSYGPVTLQIVKTLEFSAEPVSTEDQVDYVVTRNVVTVQAVFSPAATVIPNNPGDPPPINLGVSVANLQDVLMRPRQQLTYRIGNDIALAAPNPNGGGLSTNPPKTDARWGPRPLFARVLSVIGDKTAIVTFSVECWTAKGSNIILSNRWTMRQSLDEDFYTTITYQGRTKFRSSLLAVGSFGNVGPQPDQFRSVLLPTVPDTFQRRALDVQITEDGLEMAWEVRDEEQSLSLGQNSPATRLEGLITAGSEIGLKDAIQAVKGFAADQSRIALWGLAPGFAWLNGTPFPGAVLHSIIPAVKASAIIRVWGRPLAFRSDLLALAVGVALDRLSPGGQGLLGVGGTLPTSAYLTYSVEEKFVELRLEVFTSAGAIVSATFDMLNFSARVKLDGNISGVPQAPLSPALLENQGQAPVPDNSGGMRGDYLGLVIAAMLGIPGTPPPMPPTSAFGPDLPSQ